MAASSASDNERSLLSAADQSFAADQEDKGQASIKRMGMVIGVKAEKLEFYKELHARGSSGVRDLLLRYNIRNFSIFVKRLDDGKHYLFAYYEYVGKDYAADMAKLDAEPRNIAWLKMTGACQIPLAGESSWATMAELFYNR